METAGSRAYSRVSDLVLIGLFHFIYASETEDMARVLVPPIGKVPLVFALRSLSLQPIEEPLWSSSWLFLILIRVNSRGRVHLLRLVFGLGLLEVDVLWIAILHDGLKYPLL